VHKTRKSTLTYNDYNSAIRFKPDFALAYNNRGEVMADLGDNQEAIKDYNLAIRLKSDLAIAYYNRGAIKASLGDKQGWQLDWQLAAKIYKQQGNSERYNHIANQLGKQQGGIEDLLRNGGTQTTTVRTETVNGTTTTTTTTTDTINGTTTTTKTSN
jgi:tetratricopeptide (TPR) repeat protein